jgi:CRP-like cAMP-binding protein
VLVVQGLIRVYMTSSEGRQVTVRYARSGDVLGIAVLVGGPANVDVQALAPAEEVFAFLAEGDEVPAVTNCSMPRWPATASASGTQPAIVRAGAGSSA